MKKVVTLGEIMMRLSPPGFLRFSQATSFDVEFGGGLLYGLLTYPGNDRDALNFAIAASCLKHTIAGDTNLVSIDEAVKLMGGDASGSIAR